MNIVTLTHRCRKVSSDDNPNRQRKTKDTRLCVRPTLVVHEFSDQVKRDISVAVNRTSDIERIVAFTDFLGVYVLWQLFSRFSILSQLYQCSFGIRYQEGVKVSLLCILIDALLTSTVVPEYQFSLMPKLWKEAQAFTYRSQRLGLHKSSSSAKFFLG